jgi:uncharacterized lipoprotein YbaY
MKQAMRALLGLALAPAVCCVAGPAEAGSARLTGTVVYRERVALPADSEVEVKLLEIGRAGAPARTLARQVIPRPGQPPIPFELRYDSKAVIPEETYQVEARITVGGRLRFISTRRFAVLTRGAPRDRVEVLVEGVGGGLDAPGQPTPAAVLRGNLAYLQRIALPADAEAEVTLVDLSRPEAPETLASQVIRPAGQPPIPFELRFNPEEVRETVAYGLTARISYEGRVRFATPAPVRVLTQGHPRDQVRLTLPMPPVPPPAAPPRPSTPPAEPALRASEVDRRLAAYRRVDGVWRAGSASSRFEAHYLDGVLARVDERMTLGDYGSSDQRYYYRDGALSHYRSEGTRRSLGSGGKTVTQTVSLTLSLDSAGRVLAVRKLVDGKAVRVPEKDVAAAQSQARVLARLAQERSGGPLLVATAARIERGPTGFGPVRSPWEARCAASRRRPAGRGSSTAVAWWCTRFAAVRAASRTKGNRSSATTWPRVNHAGSSPSATSSARFARRWGPAANARCWCG